MKRTLFDLPEQHRTRAWIQSEIRHESYRGSATLHDCDCGRGSCRASMCLECWREVLAELQAEP